MKPGWRFARLFQIDPDHPGTAVQRQAMVDALIYDVGSRYDALNLRLARAVKAVRPFILIGFYPDMLAPAHSSPAAINFNDKIDVSGIKWFAPHEMGHLVEHYLLTEDDKRSFMVDVGRTGLGNDDSGDLRRRVPRLEERDRLGDADADPAARVRHNCLTTESGL